jgi:magnesium and cobalt transporter
MKTATTLFLQDKLNLFLDLPKDREHLLSILQNARRKNLIALDAMKMMEGALQVSQTHAHEIMIPRAQMIVISQDDRPEDFLPTVISSQHSRFPVIGDSRDEVVGILLAKDLLSYLAEEKDSRHFNMRDLLRPAFFIPESKRLDVLLREFRTNRNHMAIIVDEYAGVAGLVTIEDVIEEIVGNIEDEYDLEEAVYIKPREEGCYTVRALTPVEIFNQYFKVDFSDEEFDTIGGILTQTFGYLPKRGETLELHGLNFEVVRADKKRLHLLRVRSVLS